MVEWFCGGRPDRRPAEPSGTMAMAIVPPGRPWGGDILMNKREAD